MTTTHNDQIMAAIGAHGPWKGRLRAAIDSGKSDIPAKVVQDDHQCDFGKWLYRPEVGADEKKSVHYKTCADLHRRFHVAAAGIMALALNGKKQDAHNALEGDSDFAKLSGELTRALVAWKEA
jgi:hypothetical protein